MGENKVYLMDAVLEVGSLEEKEKIGEILDLIEGSDIETLEHIQNMITNYLGYRCGEVPDDAMMKNLIHNS